MDITYVPADKAHPIFENVEAMIVSSFIERDEDTGNVSFTINRIDKSQFVISGKADELKQLAAAMTEHL